MNIVSTFFLILTSSWVVYTQDLKNGDACKIGQLEMPGICKSTSECPALEEIRRKRSSITMCGVDLICCPNDSTGTSREANRPRRISEIKCEEYQKAVYERSTMAFVLLIADAKKGTQMIDKCGIKFIQLIIGGDKANAREFPHMALVGIKRNNEQPNWICGGSLISDQFILTAAHCLPKNPDVVRLGELDYDRTDDVASPVDYNVIDAIVHPNYRYMESKHHDIALLKLQRRILFNSFRRPACLPSSETITQKMAIVSGWGDTMNYGDGSSSLQKVVLNIFNQSECEESYSKQITEPIIRDQLCAGSKTEDKDTCQGDSGGPLQVIHESVYCMYRIIGVTSFGVTCADRIPGIYTRVYSYLDWIEEQVWGGANQPVLFED